MTRGERILEAIEEEVFQRLNPSGEDCPECGGDGYTYDCFEEFACIDPESGCADCARRCLWCAEMKRDRLKGVREAVIEANDVDVATAWLKQIGRWRDGITEDQIRAELVKAQSKSSAICPERVNHDPLLAPTYLGQVRVASADFLPLSLPLPDRRSQQRQGLF